MEMASGWEWKKFSKLASFIKNNEWNYLMSLKKKFHCSELTDKFVINAGPIDRAQILFSAYFIKRKVEFTAYLVVSLSSEQLERFMSRSGLLW